jgi:protein-disulfide isomerase
MKINMKTLMIIVIIIVAAITIGMYLYHPIAKLPPRIVINTSNQPMLGNPKAKINIIAFEDLKCHNCMRYNAEIYPDIEKKYIKTGLANYTVVTLAFIEGSIPAANAARCVYDQNKKAFFTYVKTIYANQPPESQNWATIPTLVAFANNIPGINKNKLSQCIYKSPYTQRINRNLKIAMKAMNQMVATPTLYINGYIVKPLTMKRISNMIKAIN